MKVKDLIKILQKYPQDIPIYTYDDSLFDLDDCTNEEEGKPFPFYESNIKLMKSEGFSEYYEFDENIEDVSMFKPDMLVFCL